MATTKFNLQQITKETPQWAKWMFRVTLILTTTASFIVAGDPSIPADLKVRVMLYLQGGSTAMYGFSKLFGIDLEKEVEQ
jgi:hypothetical protein